MSAPFSLDRLRDAPTALRATPFAVRFQDVDAAGTMFYARYFDWASEVYLAQLLAGGVDVPGMLARRELAIPLRHVEADYTAPLFFGDAVVVELVAADVGTTSFALGFRVRAAGDRARRHALLQTAHVCIDPGTFRPVPVPDLVRAALTTPAAT